MRYETSLTVTKKKLRLIIIKPYLRKAVHTYRNQSYMSLTYWRDKANTVKLLLRGHLLERALPFYGHFRVKLRVIY